MKKLFFAAVIMGVFLSTNIFSQEKETQVMSDSTTVAVIKTNMGTIEIELFATQTPKTVENFVGLANKNYYDGVIFHRVIDGFMIQGGDPTGTGRGGESFWGKKFNDEIVKELVFDSEGILAMANAGPNTNGSQFFKLASNSSKVFPCIILLLSSTAPLKPEMYTLANLNKVGNLRWPFSPAPPFI